MKIPEHLFYSRDHEWIRFEGDTALVGITEFAQKELGDIVFIEVETIGNNIAASEVFGTIEAVKTVSDLFMPVKGTVLELNPKIGTAPELVNSDPYGEGWIIKIKPHLAGDTKNLLTALEYGDVIAMH